VRKKPTLQDVALLAGVSTATVSNAINNSKFVAEITRRKVFGAVDLLNYIPNNLAKSLKTRDTHLIGLLVSDIANPFFPPVVRGIEDQLAINGYNILLSETNSDSVREKENLRMLLGRRIDGLIVSIAGCEEEHFSSIDIPIVFFNRVPFSGQYNTVQVKNFKAAYIGTEHLINHGYRRIAMIAGPEHLNVGRDRMRGYMQALHDCGLDTDIRYISSGEFSDHRGYMAMRILMSHKEPPEAVFTGNNALSLGAFRYLKDARIRIPDDIAFVGYDDTGWATIVDPPLTIVRYPMYEMGVQIGTLILDAIKNSGRSSTQTIEFEPELVVRRSCGCAPECSEAVSTDTLGVDITPSVCEKRISTIHNNTGVTE